MSRPLAALATSCVGLLLAAANSLAITNTWTGAVSSDWLNATNWSPQQVPTASDHVIINSGIVTVPANANFSILDLNGGALYGSWSVAGSRVVNWTAGQIGSGIAGDSLTVAAGGILNVNSSGFVSQNNLLTNSGTINWTSGTWYLYNNGSGATATIYNSAGAQFNIQCDQSLLDNDGFGYAMFNNAGTVIKSVTGGITYLILPFNNASLINVQSGTLELQKGGTVSGQYTTTNGTTFDLAGGNFTAPGVPTFSGNGQSQFISGTLTLTSNTIPNLTLAGGTVYLASTFQGGSVTNLTLTGGVLGGTNTVTGTATLGGGAVGVLTVASGGVVNWTGGTIGSGLAGESLTVAAGGVLNVSGSGLENQDEVLTNNGTINWTSGSWYLYNNGSTYLATIYNAAGGLFNIQCDQSLIDSDGFGYAVFNNAGTVLKSAAGGITSFNLPFNNTSLVNVQSGTVQLQDGGTVSGQYTTASGTVFNLAGGNFTAQGAPVFSGSGQSEFTIGTLTLASNTIPNLMLAGGTLLLAPTFQGGNITNLTLAGTILGGTNTVTGTATLGGGAAGVLTVANGAIVNWTGGKMGSGLVGESLTVAAGGVLNVNVSGFVTQNEVLTNNGTINWMSGDWYLSNNGSSYAAAIYNTAGGQFNIQCNQSLIDSQSFGYAVFNNAGIVLKSGTAGIAYIILPFNNASLVNVQSGTVEFQRGGTVSGQYTTATGTVFDLAGGNFTAPGVPTFSGSGQSQLISGNLTLTSNTIPNLTLAGGTLYLAPAFQGGTITNLTSAGTVLAGTNTVTGTATLGGGATGVLTVASNGVVNWTGGAIGSSVAGESLTVAAGGVLNVNPSVTGFVNQFAVLTNNGTINWMSGNWYLYNNGGSAAATISNAPGGVFNVLCDESLLDNNNFGYAVFNNAGTMLKSGTGAITYLILPVTNASLINVQSGTVTFQRSFTPVGGELRFGMSSLNNYGQASFTGNATLGGTVGAAWLGGYVPAAGDVFTVISYGSHTGIFTNLNLPPAAPWITNYSSTSFTLTVGGINKLAFTTGPVSGEVPTGILPPVVVQIEQPNGTPVASSGVPLTLSLIDGTGSMSGTLTRNTDASGKATFNDLSFNKVGVKTIQASGTNLTPATSASFAIVPLIGVSLTNGACLLQLNGTNNTGQIIIYASTNLKSWTPIYTNPPTPSVINFLDTTATNFPIRFYRVTEQ
jgi:hypothetical protein